MNIPDEAVEAAAWAAYELKPVELFGREHPITWEQLSDSPLGQRCKDNELAKARAALEAAAPHMLAEAWESGNRAWEDELLGNAAGTNPYRSRP